MLPRMTDDTLPELARISDAHEVAPALRHELIDCWTQVTNSGGAAGFPFPPVDHEQVAPVVDELLGLLHPRRSRSSPPPSTASSPGGSSCDVIPTGSWSTGARSTTSRPAPDSAAAGSDPP